MTSVRCCRKRTQTDLLTLREFRVLVDFSRGGNPLEPLWRGFEATSVRCCRERTLADHRCIDTRAPAP